MRAVGCAGAVLRGCGGGVLSVGYGGRFVGHGCGKIMRKTIAMQVARCRGTRTVAHAIENTDMKGCGARRCVFRPTYGAASWLFGANIGGGRAQEKSFSKLGSRARNVIRVCASDW